MKISEVSNRTGFSKDTIRYYEKLGLINLNKQNRGSNNYRYFGQKEVGILLQIKSLKAFGFTLKEIKSLFKLDESNYVHCDSINDLVDKKVLTIEQKVNELSAIKSKLLNAKKQCTGKCKDFITI